MLLSCTDEAGNVFNLVSQGNSFDISFLLSGYYSFTLSTSLVDAYWIGEFEL